MQAAAILIADLESGGSRHEDAAMCTDNVVCALGKVRFSSFGVAFVRSLTIEDGMHGSWVKGAVCDGRDSSNRLFAVLAQSVLQYSSQGCWGNLQPVGGWSSSLLFHCVHWLSLLCDSWNGLDLQLLGRAVGPDLLRAVPPEGLRANRGRLETSQPL